MHVLACLDAVLGLDMPLPFYLLLHLLFVGFVLVALAGTQAAGHRSRGRASACMHALST